jgi:division protein CdvB (Snf7/Vps24/ESCRT-III family)
MNQLTKGMKGVVTSMGSVMNTMNVEKISVVMDQFEKQFEDLDIASQFMENSISYVTQIHPSVTTITLHYITFLLVQPYHTIPSHAFVLIS